MRSQNQEGGQQQFQAGRDIVVQGVSIQDVKEIFDSKFALLRNELTEQANALLHARVERLESKLLSEFSRSPESLGAFMDPDFQFNILEAQRSAARSGAENDLDLLVELLHQRAEVPVTSRLKMATRKALDVVGQLDETGLRILTVSWYITSLIPSGTTNLNDFLSRLDSQAGPLVDAGLPSDPRWILDLDLVGCLRLDGGSIHMKNLPSIIAESKCPGFTCAGFDEEEAVELTEQLAKFDKRLTELVIPSPTTPGRYCLMGANEKHFRQIVSLNIEEELLASEPFSTLLNDAVQKNNYQTRVMTYAELRKSLRPYGRLTTLDTWWGEERPAIRPTAVGVVLAYAYLKKTCSDMNLPPLEECL